VALYQPIVLPVSISVLGLLLISAGAHQPSSGRVSGSGSRASARARNRRRTWSPRDFEPTHTPRSLMRPGFFMLARSELVAMTERYVSTMGCAIFGLPRTARLSSSPIVSARSYALEMRPYGTS